MRGAQLSWLVALTEVVTFVVTLACALICLNAAMQAMFLGAEPPLMDTAFVSGVVCVFCPITGWFSRRRLLARLQHGCRGFPVLPR